MNLKLNILHLGLALGAAGCVYLAMLESSGRSMKPVRLLALPLVTAVVAFVLLLLAAGEPLTRQTAAAALLAGLVGGGLRGWRMTLLVDQVLSRLRLPTGRDALWVSLLLAAAVLDELAVALLGRGISPFHVFPAATALACTGYFIARSFAVRLRMHRAPHVDFR